MAQPKADLSIFLRSGDYDAMHHALSAAAAAVSLGRRVDLFFFWWALERLAKNRLDEPDLERDDVSATMELRGLPTLRQLLDVVRDAPTATLFACTGSLAALGMVPPDVEPKVNHLVGWAAILERTRGVVDRFEV
jgi:peroxiredoxin family protein